MNLNQFISVIHNMARKPFRPHRYLALLAILDIIENQREPINKFFYNDDFINYFIRWFSQYHGPNDNCIPWLPFFHLKNAGRKFGGFWFLLPNNGMEEILKKLNTVRSERELKETINHAKLDDELFKILTNKEARETAKNEIINVLKRGLRN